MMRRRTALTSLLCGLLASCDDPKPSIPGRQVPVMKIVNAMDISENAPQVSLPQATALASWPQPLANAAHAPGNVSGPLGFKPLWHAGIGAKGGYRQPLAASPIIAGGQVFTMDADAVVRAFSLTDGNISWHESTRPKHSTGQNIGGGIAYDSGKIYATTGYGELLSLDATSGKILWRQKLDFPPRGAPLVAGGLAAVITQNDLLLTFNAGSGQPGWRFTGTVGQPSVTAVGITGAPAYMDGIIVAGFSSGMLAAIDANSGTPVWEQSLAGSFGQGSGNGMSDIVGSPTIAGGVVYAISLGGTFMAVDLHSGAKVWTHSATGTQPVCLAGGFAFLVDDSQMLYAVHADDGLVSWALQLPAFHNAKKRKDPIQWTGPILVNGTLVLASDHNQIALVDAVAGSLKSTVKLKAQADMPPVAVGGMLLQLTRDGTLTAYN